MFSSQISESHSIEEILNLGWSNMVALSFEPLLNSTVFKIVLVLPSSMFCSLVTRGLSVYNVLPTMCSKFILCHPLIQNYAQYLLFHLPTSFMAIVRVIREHNPSNYCSFTHSSLTYQHLPLPSIDISLKFTLVKLFNNCDILACSVLCTFLLPPDTRSSWPACWWVIQI